MKKVLFASMAVLMLSVSIGSANANHKVIAKASSCSCPNCTCPECTCTDCSNGSCDKGCCASGHSGCHASCCKK